MLGGFLVGLVTMVTITLVTLPVINPMFALPITRRKGAVGNFVSLRIGANDAPSTAMD